MPQLLKFGRVEAYKVEKKQSRDNFVAHPVETVNLFLDLEMLFHLLLVVGGGGLLAAGQEQTGEFE